jgi:hypothetical protein
MRPEARGRLDHDIRHFRVAVLGSPLAGDRSLGGLFPRQADARETVEQLQV